MGGMPPLGYDVKDRKLVINNAEARTVVETSKSLSRRDLRNDRRKRHALGRTQRLESENSRPAIRPPSSSNASMW
jgi:hypothetical protein